ncbi:MAG: hypothetical protein ABI222_09320, partial [Opitutaceae bacterium]
MRFFTLPLLLTAVTGLAVAEPVPDKKPAAAPATDELYDLGQSLFNEYATPEIKAQYAFPSRGKWDAFAGRLQHALDGDNLKELASYEPEAR